MTKTAGAPTQVVRVIRILRRLQGHPRGVLVDDLVAEHGVSRAQMRRDLAAMEEGSIPLGFDKEEGRYGKATVRLVPGDSMEVNIGKSERLALLAARKMFEVFRGTELYTDIENIFTKLMEHLPESERKTLRPLAERILYVPHGGTKVYDGGDETAEDEETTLDRINALQTAVMDQYPVDYAYKPSFGPRSAGTMEPYALVIYRNGLYVVASRVQNDGMRELPRVFAVERFEKASFIRRRRFERPADLDIERLFNDGMGIVGGNRTHHIAVEFTGWAAVEARSRRWHRSQVVSELAGKTARVDMDVAGLRDAANWVIEYGGHASVLAPPELRRMVAEAHRDGAAGNSGTGARNR